MNNSDQRDSARRDQVMALPTVEVRRHASITPAHPDDVRVSASVGPDGNLIVLWSTPDDRSALTATTTQPGLATFPDPLAPRPVAAHVTVHSPRPTVVTRIPELPLAHVTVQPLPEGRVLVAGARARWRPAGPDRNGIVYDADGQVVTQETLGDGIEHVFTTSTGDVWVGYFDEGIYGNYGWGDRDAPPPLGSTGIVRFNARLQPEWHYPSDGDGQWGGGVSDCYALNVTDDTTWSCYYDSFPVVGIRNGTVTGWHNKKVRGAKALAVAGSTVVLCGGYGPDADRLAVCVTEGDDVHVVAEYRVTLPGGQSLPAGSRIIGRGEGLHVLTEDTWYRLDLTDIPDQP